MNNSEKPEDLSELQGDKTLPQDFSSMSISISYDRYRMSLLADAAVIVQAMIAAFILDFNFLLSYI